MITSLLRQGAALVLGLPLLTSSATASTFVVDDDGGPGIDFTDLPPAVAAAGTGDLLVVRPGSYTGFTLSKALTILADAGAVVPGTVTVDGAGGRVGIVGLEMSFLAVRDCPEPVLFDAITVGGTFNSNAVVESCDDVRFIDASISGGPAFFEDDGVSGIHVVASRVEIVSSDVQGADARDMSSSGFNCLDSGYGGHGVFADQSYIECALSNLVAGDGGDAYAALCTATAGDGGTGLYLRSSDARLLGTGVEVFEAGDGGNLNGLGYCGEGGDGIGAWNGSSVRHSDVVPVRGSNGCGPGTGSGIAPFWANATEALPADPSLERIGTPAPGSSVVFRIRGEPGSFARLFLGRRPIVSSDASIVGDLLVQKLRTIDLGSMPASGFVDRTVFLPGAWPQGMTFVAQASLVYPGGQIRRSNSTPVILR